MPCQSGQVPVTLKHDTRIQIEGKGLMPLTGNAKSRGAMGES